MGVIPTISTTNYNTKRKETPISKKKEQRKNDRIRAPRVQVVDEKGEFLGEMDIEKALAMAQDLGLDLVEIAPGATPPVTRIVDFGKAAYEKEKEQRKQRAKQKKTELKGIRLTFKIGEHDLAVRIKAGRKFLDAGHKLKLEMRLRGREKGARDLAKQKLMEYVERLERDAKIEGRINYQHSRLTAIVSAKQAKK